MSRPARGAWIEIQRRKVQKKISPKSRPARGAWIEMPIPVPPCPGSTSRPARGAWIEIVKVHYRGIALRVAPRKGRVD